MRNIAVLGGGYTSERQISLNSAKQVFENIDKKLYYPYLIDVTDDGLFCVSENDKIPVDLNSFSISINNKSVKFDFAYIVLHGSPGEDGKIQGYLDMVKVPYSACDVYSSSITYNKEACKKILSDSGITLAKSVIINQGQSFCVDEIIEFTGLPCFVKPNTSGSSYGISKVYEKEKFVEAVNNAEKEDPIVIVEEFIDGTEVSCGILKTSENLYLFPVTEISTKNDFFDTEAKYNPGLTDEITPARISDNERDKVHELVSLIYNKLNCKGIVRIDFIIRNGIPYFLEVNSVPGMSAESIIPKQVKCMGKDMRDMLTEVIEDNFTD